MKTHQFAVLLVIFLSACASKERYRHPPETPFIRYSQNDVVVSVPPFKDGRAIGRPVYYLNSNVHGRNISSAKAMVPQKKSNGTYNNVFGQITAGQNKNIRLEAKLALPKQVAAHTGNVCFYVTDQLGNVVPARFPSKASTNGFTPLRSVAGANPSHNQSGFTNTLWQETYALPAMRQGVSNEIQKIGSELANLTLKIAAATEYVERGEIIVNSQCTVPQHSQSAPASPFNKVYLSLEPNIPYGVCLQAGQTSLSISAKRKLIDNDSSQYINVNHVAMQKTIEFVHYELEAGRADLAFPEAVSSAFAQTPYTRSCYDRNCRLEKKLFNGSKYRSYMTNFSRCVRDVNKQIFNTKRNFETDLQTWQNEPQRRFEECKVQTTVFNRKDIELNSLIRKQQTLNARLVVLKSKRPERPSPYQLYTAANKTTCSVGG